MSLIDNLHIQSITKMTDFKIGNAENKKGGTGCTVIISEEGAVTGVDVRGGGPATRETDRLNPTCKIEKNNAVVLSGGSAFGLDASAGVMEYLEEKSIGYETGFGIVPLVSGACVYDLMVADSKCRPDKDMGYKACENAYKAVFKEGNYGAGTGCAVGKFLGPSRMMKGGLGTFCIKTGDLEIGAIVAVNALGDIYNMEEGTYLAGLLNEQQDQIIGTESIILDKLKNDNDFFEKNTTIGCILTNATLTNAEATKISSLAHNGLARVIWPVHTSADGDAIFTMTSGKINADADIVGAIAGEVMAFAINNAVKNAESAYGLKAAKDFQK